MGFIDNKKHIESFKKDPTGGLYVLAYLKSFVLNTDEHFPKYTKRLIS